MPIFTIRHLTTYHYRQPVAFGEHTMMLRPRDDDDQTVLEADLDITPRPSEISWTQDSFGNHVATVRFAERAAELRFDSRIRLDHAPAGFGSAEFEELAPTRRFAEVAADKHHPARFRAPPAPHPVLADWIAGFLAAGGTADPRLLPFAMTRTMKRTFRHVARHEKGIQDPARTIAIASGSCRDLAALMIAALRSLAIPARFVSGYLHLPDDPDPDTGGNTHAWVQAYIPGAGWVDFDPSSGSAGNRNLVRVAVVDEPHEAIPLQGTWFGTAADHLAMKVAVKVTATETGPAAVAG